MRTDFGQSTTFASRVAVVVILLEVCITSESMVLERVYASSPFTRSKLRHDSGLSGAYVPSRQSGEIAGALQALVHSRLEATHLILASPDGHAEAVHSSLAFGTRRRRLRAHSGQLSSPTYLLSGKHPQNTYSARMWRTSKTKGNIIPTAIYRKALPFADFG